MTPNITVVGSFAVGMTIRASRLPVFGETMPGTDFDMGPGGKGSNQAVAIARLGGHASLVAIIGADKLGSIATDLYEAEGVEASHVIATEARATGAGLIILNKAGENFIVLDMGANELMDVEFVDKAARKIAEADVVMSVLEIPVAAAQRAMELGKKAGAITVLNPAPAVRLPDSIFGFIDYLTPNESELRVLMGLDADDPRATRDLARDLSARGVGNVIVTMGRSGVLVLTNESDEIVPAIPVKVVDTTGAGDAFNAGLAIALGEGQSLMDAIRFAVVCGGCACTRLGVVPALPTRAIVDRFMPVP